MKNMYVNAKYMTLKGLSNMITLLEKIQTQLPSKDFSETDLLDSRLALDMFPLSKQIQIISDNAKGLNARFSAIEAPSMADEEKTLQELIERLKKTTAFITSIDDGAYSDAEERKIILPYFPGKYQTAEDYLNDFALPNFFFHYTTAYAILRMKGFEIGKTDFLGSLNLRDL